MQPEYLNANLISFIIIYLSCRCHQLLVNYTKISWHEWEKHPQGLDKIEWDVADTKLLINSEGCGYPPHVNCTEFAKKYGYSETFLIISTIYYMYLHCTSTYMHTKSYELYLPN